jgi:hypothetical protein
MIGISVRAKYGPAIEREPRGARYLCLAYPCPNSTRLFYRPANSHLCVGCIRARRSQQAASAAATNKFQLNHPADNNHKADS